MRKRGETARAKEVVALMEEIGPTRAAKELHVSTTLLHKAKKSGVVTAAIEIAARAVRQQLAGKMPAHKHVPDQPAMQAPAAPAPEPEETMRSMMLVEGTPAKIKALRDAAQWLGVKTEE